MKEMAIALLLFIVLASSGGQSAASDGMKCPEGWLLKIASCYRWGTNPMTFHQAQAQCESWGSRLRVIKNEEENNLFSGTTIEKGTESPHIYNQQGWFSSLDQRVSSSGEYFWLGIRRQNRYSQWFFVENGVNKGITYRQAINGNSRALCLLWHSTNTNWLPETCGTAHLFICQQDPECISGRFGTNCTGECHCRGQPCNSTTGICAGGCQLGWTGESCSAEKLRAEAKFYCFKIRRQNTLMLRVDQRGTRYRTVTAYNKDGTESPGCNKTHFNHFELGAMATLKVTQQKNKEFTPLCGEQKMSEDVVTWKFKFQEFPMTSSAYDVLFEVTCDFKNADTLTRLVTSNSEKSTNKTTILSETKVSVSLDVIDPFSDQPLTTVKLGQQVKLQLNLNNGDDFGVTAIAPYNCSASTLDGAHSVLFKDEKGCSPEDSQIVFNSTELTKWQSELFEAFTFQGYDKINFQCQFHVCFSEEHNFCKDTCAHSKKRKSQKLHRRRRRRRHQSSPNDEEGKELGTTVNIMT